MDYVIRKALLPDCESIKKLIAESARGLSRADYSDRQIEAAIATVFGVDTTLINDGTYFVAECEGQLIGGGGWSKRKTLFGGDQFVSRDSSEIDPQTEPAKIRAFFIHPKWSRKGVARAILSQCESAASTCGFRSLELMATLPGVKFYEASGYTAVSGDELEIKDGVTLKLVKMRKQIE